jgi:hypothetical protein
MAHLFYNNIAVATLLKAKKNKTDTDGKDV